jgi:hypothetical protein
MSASVRAFTMSLARQVGGAVEADDVGAAEHVLQAVRPRAAPLAQVVAAHVGGVDEDVHADGLEHGRKGLRDGAVADDPAGLAGGPRGLVACRGVPAARADLPVLPGDLLEEVDDEPKRVQGDVVGAEVGNVRHVDVARRRALDVDVREVGVHVGDHPKRGHGLHELRGDGRRPHHQPVRVSEGDARGTPLGVEVDVEYRDVRDAPYPEQVPLVVEGVRALEVGDSVHGASLPTA